MNYLIGSRALNHWFPSFRIREDTDWDIISEEEVQGPNIEWHDTRILNNACISDYSTDSTIEYNGLLLNVVSPLGLSLIKRSHLHRDIGFQKHISQWVMHLSQIQQSWAPVDKSWLEERTRLTHIAYPQRTPNLMQGKDAFFDDAVPKVYEHDYLHELFAFYHKPLYTRLLKDSQLAWCEKDAWDKFTHEDKVKCVQEEVYVIALERFIIPKSFDFNYKIAYNKALAKVCTTLCSGWFRDFAIDNFLEIEKSYDKSKFDFVISRLKGE